jgi:hypothetical protein
MTTRPSPPGRTGSFVSGLGLSTGQLLFDAYLAPLLCALRPWVWAFPAPRMVNVVLFDLGRLIAGTKETAAELLALLGPPGIARGTDKPLVTPIEMREALQWWVRQPGARAAVAALAKLQDGFFLRRNSADTIRLPDRNGREQEVSLERATAEYLLGLRNSTHGFGGRFEDAGRRVDTLLAAHTGELPDDLALLAYLYLLDLLADPDPLMRRLGASRHP